MDANSYISCARKAADASAKVGHFASHVLDPWQQVLLPSISP